MIKEIAFYTCLIMLILGKMTEKRFFNPITMFYSLWSIILGLSSLRLFNLAETRNEIYLLIFIGLISFAIGYYTYKYFKIISLKKKVIDENKNIEKTSYELNYKFIYFIALICIIFYLKDLVSVLQYLFNGKSLAYIRELAQDSTSILYSSKSKIENGIKILCIAPFSQALQPIVATDLIFGKKDKKLFILNIVIIALKVITDGSRTLVVYFLISLVVSLSLNDKKIIKNKKKKNRLKQNSMFLMLIVIVVFVLYKITASRSGENIVKFAYYYFSMQPIMFDKWAMIVDSKEIYGYGISASNGFGFIIFYIIKNIFGIAYPELWSNVYGLIEGTGTNWQTISTLGTQANSFVSAFWVLYVDGRLAGIIIGMIVYGIIMSKSYWNAKNRKSKKHISIYIFLYIGLFYTFVRLQFANVYYDAALLYLLIPMYIKKRRKTL